MNRKLLEYYNRELTYLREMGAEFAQSYPKVAGRLGMQGIDVADPYIERLLEGVAFLTSRVQLKMDAEFPRFSQRLLDIIYPNYLAPTPSMAIAEIQPDSNKGDISAGFLVPRGTMLDSQMLKKNGVTCSYTTAQDVRLQPVRLNSVELGGIPADLPLASLGLQHNGCASALRIKLECYDTVTLNNLKLDQLMFYLSGSDIHAQQLQELIMQHTVGLLCQTVEAQPQRRVLPPTCCVRKGSSPSRRCCPTICVTLMATVCYKNISPFPHASSSLALVVCNLCYRAPQKAKKRHANLKLFCCWINRMPHWSEWWT